MVKYECTTVISLKHSSDKNVLLVGFSTKDETSLKKNNTNKTKQNKFVSRPSLLHVFVFKRVVYEKKT